MIIFFIFSCKELYVGSININRVTFSKDVNIFLRVVNCVIIWFRSKFLFCLDIIISFISNNIPTINIYITLLFFVTLYNSLHIDEYDLYDKVSVDSFVWQLSIISTISSDWSKFIKFSSNIYSVSLLLLISKNSKLSSSLSRQKSNVYLFGDE